MARSPKGMEASFGNDFSGVRVHQSRAEAAHVSAHLGAQAFTQGSQLAFGGASFTEADGKPLLAHEASHVVQQRQGGQQPPAQKSPAEHGQTLQQHARLKQGK